MRLPSSALGVVLAVLCGRAFAQQPAAADAGLAPQNLGTQPTVNPLPQPPAGTTPSNVPPEHVPEPREVPQATPKEEVLPSAPNPSGTNPVGTTNPAITTKSTNPIDDAQRIPIPSVLGVDIRFSGYFWADTGYMARDNAQQGQYDQNISYLQGRFVLGAGLSRAFGDYYAAAKVEFLGLVNEFARSQYEPHTLDAYARVGHSKWWDVQVGRFLAWEVYHRGQGIEFWTAEEAGALGGPALYWLDLTRGYRNESGQAAIHLYPFEFLKFEVAGVYGQENNQNTYGVRPAFHLTIKDFQLLGGYEGLWLRPQTEADKVQTTTHGFAGRIQYTFFKAITAGFNGSWATVDATDIQGIHDTERSLNKFTLGGFIDIDFWKNSIGLGYHYTDQLNQQGAAGENNRHHQAFVSYLFRLPIQGLSLKAVYGFANAHIEDADANATWENYVHSFRLRLSYEFN